MAVNVEFFHSSLTGVSIAELGSGTFDHFRFSASTSGAGVVSGFFQDTTWISDDAGSVAGSAGTSGQLVNNKRISSTGVAITAHSGGSVAYSGSLAGITGVVSGSLPDFTLRPSGTVFVKLSSDDASVFLVNSAEIWMDDGITVTAAPSGATFYAVEYDKDGCLQSSWPSINGSGSSLALNPHTVGNGYSLATDHYFALGLSATATTSGALTGRLGCVFNFGA